MDESKTPRSKQIITNLRYWWGHPRFQEFALKEIGALETDLSAMTVERDALLVEQKTLTEVINIQASRDKPIRDNLIKRTKELSAALDAVKRRDKVVEWLIYLITQSDSDTTRKAALHKLVATKLKEPVL